MVYHLFNTETAFGLAKGRESDIAAWYDCIREMLDPSILLLNEQDQQKIIALLAREKEQIDKTPESADLFERLIEHI